jgi:lysophospholipase L1-like esterase
MNPKLYLLLIGTNNITQNGPDPIMDGIIEIVKTIRIKCADSKIIVFGLLPREYDDIGNDCRGKIIRVNKALEKNAEKENYVYRYFGDVFLKNGNIDRSLMPDGLHPDRKGYAALGPILQTLIRESLKDQ